MKRITDQIGSVAVNTSQTDCCTCLDTDFSVGGIHAVPFPEAPAGFASQSQTDNVGLDAMQYAYCVHPRMDGQLGNTIYVQK